MCFHHVITTWAPFAGRWGAKNRMNICRYPRARNVHLDSHLVHRKTHASSSEGGKKSVARANTLNVFGAGPASTSCKVVLSRIVDDCSSNPRFSPCDSFGEVVRTSNIFSLFHFSLFLHGYLSRAIWIIRNVPTSATFGHGGLMSHVRRR